MRASHKGLTCCCHDRIQADSNVKGSQTVQPCQQDDRLEFSESAHLTPLLPGEQRAKHPTPVKGVRHQPFTEKETRLSKLQQPVKITQLPTASVQASVTLEAKLLAIKVRGPSHRRPVCTLLSVQDSPY